LLARLPGQPRLLQQPRPGAGVYAADVPDASVGDHRARPLAQLVPRLGPSAATCSTGNKPQRDGDAVELDSGPGAGEARECPAAGADPAPGGPAIGSGEPVAGESVAGQPDADQPARDDERTGQPDADQPVAREPDAGEPERFRRAHPIDLAARQHPDLDDPTPAYRRLGRIADGDAARRAAGAKRHAAAGLRAEPA